MTDIFKPNYQEVLGFTYLPPRLPHREKQIEMILETFKPFLEGYRTAFNPPLLYGKTGTGKTSSMKLAANMIRKKMKKDVVLHYAHINCTIHGKSYLAAQKIAEKVSSIPVRGYGESELLSRVYEELETRDEYLLLVLDDLDDLIRRDRGRLLYIVTRLEEMGEFPEKRILPVLIMRSEKMLMLTQPAVRSKITGFRIPFPPYTKEEMMSIVKQRVDLALNPRRITKNAMLQISYNSAVLGEVDARQAINLLKMSGETARKLGREKILVEHVRMAQQSYGTGVLPGMEREVDRIGLTILMAIARIFKDDYDKFSASMTEIYREFSELSKKMDTSPIPSKEVKAKIAELSDLGIISIVDKRVVLPSISADELYQRIASTLFKET